METIVDFKQANQPKQREWIDDYFMQIAAYAMAHDYVYKSKIRQGVIMICTPDRYYQEFKFQDVDLKREKHKFLERLNQYYELIHDPKEQTDVDKDELLKEFEQQTRFEKLAIKVRNDEIPADEVFNHFEDETFWRFFKNKYRKEIYGMSSDYIRKIGYKKPTKKKR